MRKKRFYLVLLILAGAGVVGLIVAGAFREREPEYGGKRLSEWVEGYRNAIAMAKFDKTERDRTDNAVRQIGTNAVPLLREWFRYEPGATKMKFYAVGNGLLQVFTEKWTFRDHREIRADYVPEAMRALRPEAAVVAEVVELSGAIKDPNAHRSALRAADLLVSFGQVSSLAPGLTNRHEEVRESMARRIGSMGTNTAFAVPALLRLLQDASDDVRDAATNALRAIDPKALEGSAP